MTINQKNNKISSLSLPCLKTPKLSNCFEGKKPTEVTIELDLGADVVDRLYQQFWRLEGLYQLNMVYKEIRRYLPSFLTLFRIMKHQRMMTEQDVVEALRFGKELP
jgi:hypothetical protein